MPPFDPQFVIGYAAITCMQKAEFTYLHFESRGKIYSPGLLGVIDPKSANQNIAYLEYVWFALGSRFCLDFNGCLRIIGRRIHTERQKKNS